MAAEQNGPMENDLQTAEILIANQRHTLTGPSLKLAENCGFCSAWIANPRLPLRREVENCT